MDQPVRSLNIPKKKLSPSYEEYSKNPNVNTLDQVMLNYFDMEEILKLYNNNH